MFYYQRQIGDYAAATRHLTLLEHGVYAMMLDAYYLNESPLPADIEKLCRLIGARSDDERKAVVAIAEEFFDEHDGMLWQTRCDAEIQKIQVKSEKAKASANARWGKHSDSDGNANAMRTHTDGNANGMLSKTQDPRPKTQEDIPASPTPVGAVEQCDLASVVDAYHNTLSNLPRVRMLDRKRLAALRVRQKEYPKAREIDWWQSFFAAAGESRFLMGESGDRSWKADFDFLLSPKGFKGVIEGKYQ